MRSPRPSDHGRVLAVMDIWWGDLGGPEGSKHNEALFAYPRPFFQHFTPCSYLIEDDDARLIGFLIGFLSASQPDVAYIHFVGVDPEFRHAGLGAALYAQFFSDATRRGAQTVKCITSPENDVSVAFRRALGFDFEPDDHSPRWPSRPPRLRRSGSGPSGVHPHQSSLGCFFVGSSRPSLASSIPDNSRLTV